MNSQKMKKSLNRQIKSKMGLQGINSMRNSLNYISPDITDFLISEDFKVAKKSDKPRFAHITQDPKFVKQLGANEQFAYVVFVTGNEIVVETHFIDTEGGNEVLREKFSSDNSFVQAYNFFIEWYTENQ